MSTASEIDIDHLLSMTGGDIDLAEEVIDIFRQQVDIWSRMLNIGAHELAERCQAAETAGRDLPPSAAGAALLLNDIKDEIAATLEACSRAVHTLSRPGLRASKASNS